jgi:very-short-patch-repair endonuclease
MGDKTRSHRAVAQLAGRQHGLVSSAQLAVLGFSRQVTAGEVARGRLHPVHRGVFGVGHRSISRQGRCLAAVMASGAGTLLSHRSAAWAWGLTRRWTETVEVTAPRSRRRREGIRPHGCDRLLAEDRDIVEGIPVTAVPKTLLDFAAVDPAYLAQALNRAAQLGLLDLLAVDDLLSRSGGRRGASRLRASLLDHRDPRFTRSGFERRFLRLAREAGLPPPSTNLFVEGYELDIYWARERFAVELDTFDYHGDRGSFEADRLRQEDLKLAGIEMTRITARRLEREPATVMRRVAMLLAQRRDLSL